MKIAPTIQTPLLKIAVLTLLFTLLLNACNVMKYIPEDQKLYTGAKVNIKTKGPVKGEKELQYAIEDVISPKPNSSLFGLRIGLWAHFKAQQPDPGKLVKFLDKKFGEKPVYLSQVNLETTRKIINNRCENRGFFYSEIDASIKEKKRTASAEYDITVSRPYLLKTYVFNRDSTLIDSLIKQSLKNTQLKEGTRFDTEKFKAERNRIDDYLKNKGYYEFNPEYLIFTSDTNQYQDRSYDLYLSFKKQAPKEALKPYSIKNVKVYPDYNVARNDTVVTDSTMVDSIEFIQHRLIFKPHLLRDYITFRPGEYYEKNATDITTQRLSSMGIFKLVSIRYDRVKSDSLDAVGSLKASILLTPAKRQAVRLEVQTVTKSNSFAGPGLLGSYQNKNLFHGGEILDITGNISYETQISRGSNKGLSTFEFKLSNSITFPRLIAPFKIDPQTGYSVPNTKFSLNYSLQARDQYYTLHSLLFSYGYNWKSNRFIYQELNPVSINYTSVTHKTPAFRAILDKNPFLKRSFEDQFIPGLTYTFQYSELGEDESKKSRIYFNLGADLAGNTFGALQDAFKSSNKELFGLPYAQYLKGDIDFRHYLKIGRESKFVTRLFAGAGYPYGNSSSLPYVKQYFAGGPNSVRAFRVRSLGPGSYHPADDNSSQSYFDQSGDIRLETNAEFRFPMISILKGAVFVDAGNIWLMNDNPAIPGGQFSSNWYKELALGTGYGLRLDIQFLIIRLDVSFPLRYPYELNNSHWQQDFAFGQKSWRRENLIWNFAIGYPF